MVFFALVYVVEGVGQTGGLIAQPLNYYLKQVYRLDAAAGHRVADDPQPALGHQAGLRDRLRFRAAVRLSPQGVSDPRQPGRGRGLWLGDAGVGAGPADLRAAADRLCDGGVEHPLRRGAGRERAAAPGQRRLRQPAMAVVQHRRDGECGDRRPAGRAAVAGGGAARGRGDRRGRAARRRLRRGSALLDEPRTPTNLAELRRRFAASAALPTASCG